jgi:DNA polymerase III alpha subunit
VIAIAGYAATSDGPSPRGYFASLRTTFGERVFVEYRDALPEPTRAYQVQLLQEAAEIGIAPVLVQDVRFVGPARHQLVDLVASATERAFEHRVFSDPRIGVAGVEHGMRTAAEMSSAYDGAPEAHSNAALIAALVQPDLLEALETREPEATGEMFSVEGEGMRVLRARVGDAFAARIAREPNAEERRAVLTQELADIEREGLAETMVQFAEVVSRLRDAGVMIGPANGLSLQSLCAYLLGLTVFDPYAVDTHFQAVFDLDARVLALQTAPQFRPRVLASLNRVFDGAGIGYVPSVEHITPARALRIVAKRFGAAPPELEEAVKVASRHPGVTLRELSEHNRAFVVLHRKSATFREMVSHAAAIEGLPFGFARTKRSVIVSPHPLRNYFGFTIDPETGDRFVQATRDSFPCGEIRRIDVATLQILAVVGDAWEEPAPDDEAAYALISKGDLEGVYLLEGPPGRIAAAFGIQSFEELVHFLALLRQRRTGVSFVKRVMSFRDAAPKLPAAEKTGDVLASTNGQLLFEDQVRDVIARLTKLPARDAARMVARFRDHAPGNLAALRQEFLSLTVEAGISFDDATAWFARLLRSAGSVDQRQRAIAEAMVTRRCLGAKVRDRVGFFARLLNGPIDSQKRARYRGVLEGEGAWLPPSVGSSARGHVVEGGSVRAPLWTVEGITRETSDALIRMRAGNPLTTGDEARSAVSRAGIDPQVVDALARAGAFDQPAEASKTPKESHRAVPARSKAGEQMSIPLGTLAPPMTPNQPVEKVGNLRQAFHVISTLSEFYPHPSATPIVLAGRIRNFHDYKDSSGKAVSFFELFDSSASVRVFVPWDRVVRHGEPLGDGHRVTVKGKVRIRDGRKVCDALELVVNEGGHSHGEDSPDNPSNGDP